MKKITSLLMLVALFLVIAACNFPVDDKLSEQKTAQEGASETNNIDGKPDIDSTNEIGSELPAEKPKDEPPVVNSAPRFTSVVGYSMNIIEAKFGTVTDINFSQSAINFQPGDIVCQPMLTSDYSEIIETSRYGIQKAQNTGFNLGIGEGLPFSGGLNEKYGSNTSESSFSYYVQIMARSILYHEYVVNGNSPAFWASRLSRQILNDFYSLSPSMFLDRYGAVIVTEAWYGSIASMNWHYTGTALKDKNQIAIGMKATYDGISGGIDWSNKSEAVEFNSNSTFTYFVNNAIADFQSADEFKAGYKAWFARAAEAPSFVGANPSTYLPIWVIFMAYADLHPERAAEIIQRAESIRNEFFERAFECASKLDFLTIHTQVFNAVGGDRFFLPADLNGTLRQFMVSCIGAPGGGQGSCLSGSFTQSYYPGAGGGSPAGLRFGFLSTADVTIDLYVGQAGAGGGKRVTSSSSKNGHTGDSGQASWVRYNDITLTADGGQGGGEPGGRTAGAGGTASSNPGTLQYFMRVDGNRGGNGGNSAGAGGASVSIDGFGRSFSSGSGGRGGTQGAGSAGSANGLIAIQWATLD
jgi:hypothetical protein